MESLACMYQGHQICYKGTLSLNAFQDHLLFSSPTIGRLSGLALLLWDLGYDIEYWFWISHNIGEHKRHWNHNLWSLFHSTWSSFDQERHLSYLFTFLPWNIPALLFWNWSTLFVRHCAALLFWLVLANLQFDWIGFDRMGLDSLTLSNVLCKSDP